LGKSEGEELAGIGAIDPRRSSVEVGLGASLGEEFIQLEGIQITSHAERRPVFGNLQRGQRADELTATPRSRCTALALFGGVLARDLSIGFT
jgi:hypothetical protein